MIKKKYKHKKAKGVDISMVTELLSNAYMNVFDVAFLVTGDGDFLPAMSEVQRLGKRVNVVAFEDGLNEELKLSSDSYMDCKSFFVKAWQPDS